MFTSSTKDKDGPPSPPITFKDPSLKHTKSRKSMSMSKQQKQRKMISSSSSSLSSSSRRISSLNSIIAAGDKEKLFLLRKKKESFDHITTKILKEQQQQKLTAMHYTALYEYALFIPSISLTLLSGILAILVKSTLVPSEKAQCAIALVIAVIAVLSTFVQSLMKQLNFGGRAGYHESCSTSLLKIYRSSRLKIQEQKYNDIFKALKTGNRVSIGANLTTDDIDTIDDDDDEDDDDDDGYERGNKGEEENADTTKGSAASFFASHSKEEQDSYGKEDPTTVEKNDEKMKKDDNEGGESTITSQFHQAVDTCNSEIPINITAAFNMLEARIELVNKSTLRDKTHSKIVWENVKPALYYQLTETILQSRKFPLSIPNPKWSVDKTLVEFKQHLRSGEENNADLVQHLIERSNVIANYGDNMSGSTKPLLLAPHQRRRDTIYDMMDAV